MKLNINDPKVREMLANKIDKNTGKKVLDLPLEEGLSRKISLTSNKESPGSVAKKQKYGNKCFWEDGIYWRSIWEHQCYKQLQVLERTGEIEKLELQKKFEFVHNGVRIGAYVSDFTFYYLGNYVVADAKHEQTEKQHKFTLQKKLMKAFYSIDILMIYKSKGIYSALEERFKK